VDERAFGEHYRPTGRGIPVSPLAELRARDITDFPLVWDVRWSLSDYSYVDYVLPPCRIGGPGGRAMLVPLGWFSLATDAELFDPSAFTAPTSGRM
jgi:hypothetical protein